MTEERIKEKFNRLSNGGEVFNTKEDAICYEAWFGNGVCFGERLGKIEVLDEARRVFGVKDGAINATPIDREVFTEWLDSMLSSLKAQKE